MFAVRVFGLRHAAEAAERRPARLGRRETLPEVLLSGFLEMTGNLPAQVPVTLARANQPAYARQEHTKPPHDGSS
jgi:hypothetical protein